MPIKVWKEIKATTRKIFVLTHNYKEIYNKLQTLSQDSKSMVEYFKEIKVVMIRANIFRIDVTMQLLEQHTNCNIGKTW